MGNPRIITGPLFQQVTLQVQTSGSKFMKVEALRADTAQEATYLLKDGYTEVAPVCQQKAKACVPKGARLFLSPAELKKLK